MKISVERLRVHRHLQEAVAYGEREGFGDKGLQLGMFDCIAEDVLLLDEEKMSIDTLVLVDSKNWCYRAHFVHRFLQSRGRPTSVLFGALKMLAAAAHRMPHAAFVFVWDGDGNTWRHEITKGIYKGNRQGIREDVLPAIGQLPILKKALIKAGFRHFEYPHLECDDLIGIIATKVIEADLFDKVIVYSTDKDFYQLATDRIGIMRGYDKDHIEQVMFVNEVAAEIGIEPKDWVKVKAIMGDVTDNIDKLQTGLGPKTAIKMIQAGFDPSLENFKDHKWAPRQNFQLFASMWGKVKLNYELCQIVRKPSDKHLPAALCDDLCALIDNLERKHFLRPASKSDDESLQEFTDFLLEYEMHDIFDQRHALWKLP